MGLNVLVTGGAGYIGSHAAKALARAGHAPIVYDSLIAGYRDAVRWGPLVEADLADEAALAAAIRRFDIGAVMHFAASADVAESMIDPARFFRNNVSKTLTLLDVMRAHGVRHIVFSSSAAIYGIPRHVPIPEDAPPLPVNPYGDSKLMCERLLLWEAAAHGTTYAALRYFNAAGADPEGDLGENHRPEHHLIPLLLDAALGRRDAINVFGTDYPTKDGTAIRDFIHVHDLAVAHVKALEHLLAGGASVALNLGTGHGQSINEVIAAAERVLGRAIARRNAPRRAGDPPALVADPALAQRTLRWAPIMSDLESILRSALAHRTRLPE